MFPGFEPETSLLAGRIWLSICESEPVMYIIMRSQNSIKKEAPSILKKKCVMLSAREGSRSLSRFKTAGGQVNRVHKVDAKYAVNRLIPISAGILR